ncbi:t-SNARE [Geopyxis carbonaria]|nr:t-SNARE [Geopyxis carbonaria]
MSFDRLSSLESQPTTSRSTGYSDDPEFAQLTTQLSARLVTLISNITQLNRQLALVGTKKDSETVRDRVKRLTDETRAGFKAVSDGVRRVQNWPDVSPSMKYAQDKLQNQLASALTDFQGAQRLSAEKTRQYVSAARKAQHEMHDEGRVPDELDAEPYEGDGVRQMQVPLVQQQAALAEQGEVDFQESLIVAREEEIRGIEQGITEINDIFKDLGTLVSQQGDQLDMIDGHVSRAAQDHKAADQELRSASRYQKGARNRACCLLLILAVVLAVVLLAVSLQPTFAPPPLPPDTDAD